MSGDAQILAELEVALDRRDAVECVNELYVIYAPYLPLYTTVEVRLEHSTVTILPIK